MSNYNLWLTSNDYFKYLKPVLKSIEPDYAPYSHPVVVMLKGKNLDIGNTQVILNEVKCNIITLTSQIIECIPGPFAASNSITDGKVTLQIDSTLIGLDSSYFRYLPNAVIHNASIKSTLATITSNITFFGEYLDSLFKPKIKATFVNNQRVRNVSNWCHIWNSTAMTCGVPMFPLSHYPLDKDYDTHR